MVSPPHSLHAEMVHRGYATSSDAEDRSSASSTLNRRNLRLPAYAFILPNLEQFPDDFRRFLEKEMIEIHTLKRLESSGHLNWWCSQNAAQRLWPLVTTGDGNCLLHAASLGIWGVHDRQLNLRQLLHEVLTTGERRNAFYRRWRWHESKSNLQSELVLTEQEWEKEWKGVLELAAPTPRVNLDVDGKGSNEQIYESLECIHVFALAQVLRRPIVVVADAVLRNANGEELAPIPFGGIYLPIEFKAEHCHRSPLVLCYDASHFSALVAMRQATSNFLQAIPITDRNRNLLPVHFSVDPGSDFTWWKDGKDQQIANELDSQQTDDLKLELMGTYMDIVKMDLRRGSIKKTVPMVNGTEFTPSIPLKLLTLASGNSDSVRSRNSNGSRILKEIRQHFKWLTRRSKRKVNRPIFSANELRQSNCVLTVLLHNYAHQYMDSMMNNYIVGVRERFERYKLLPSAVSVPKNRLSRSFSSSSVLLTCLNPPCNKNASPSTNFLCSTCFEDQKREMASLGSASASSTSPNSNQSTGNSSFEQCSRTDSAYCSKSSTMPALVDSLNEATLTPASTPAKREMEGNRTVFYTPSQEILYQSEAERLHSESTRLQDSRQRPSHFQHSDRPLINNYPVEVRPRPAPRKLTSSNYSNPTYCNYNYSNPVHSDRTPVFSPVQRYVTSSNSLSPSTPLAPIMTPGQVCGSADVLSQKGPSNGVVFYYAASS